VLLFGLLRAEHYDVPRGAGAAAHATLMIAWLLSLFWHSQLGLAGGSRGLRARPEPNGLLQLPLRFACALGAIASVLAVCRIVFAA
jgi:succinate dehydrogenase / fumarate reductase membrane anchor subunit